jgi:hypothetical protein
MSENDKQTSASALAGPFVDPFKNWPNSDLLIDEEDREFFTRHFPSYAPIFDWPELRALFESYDHVAATARKHSRRSGVIAVLAGLLRLGVAATVPLVDELSRGVPGTEGTTQAVLGGVAAAFAILSVLIGYTQVLTGRQKSRWLINRFWAERTRQFHFQLIVNHLPAVIAAVNDKDRLQEWLAFRTTQLDQFNHDYLRGVEDKIHHLELDEAEDSPWLNAEWERPGPVPAASSELEVILKLMEQQRFGIQQRYAERKLRHGWHSPETLAQWVLNLSDTFTAVLLLATIIAGIGSVLVLSRHASPLIHFIAGLIAAIASSTVVAMRALKEGLLFSADAERYRWYLAAVRTLYRRFERGDLARKVFLLRELEHVAYQEMRRFILSCSQARFVM